MATNPPTPVPQNGAAPQQPGAAPSPSSAPASPLQMLLARWYQTAKQIAADPSGKVVAPQMEKIADAIQEAQTALQLNRAPRPNPAQTPPQ